MHVSRIIRSSLEKLYAYGSGMKVEIVPLTLEVPQPSEPATPAVPPEPATPAVPAEPSVPADPVPGPETPAGARRPGHPAARRRLSR